MVLATGTACSGQTSEQTAIMRAIEAAVVLPEGASALDDYSRNYALQPDGKIIAVFVIPRDTGGLAEDAGCETMLENGDARPCTEAEMAEDKAFEEALANAHGEAGQSRWFDDRLELPAVNGGGCGFIEILYDPQTAQIERAECNGDA
jgi:hypothetical protein